MQTAAGIPSSCQGVSSPNLPYSDDARCVRMLIAGGQPTLVGAKADYVYRSIMSNQNPRCNRLDL